ncbi:unnamed protein product [Lactuca virosa]|uniref:Uncharacterized protein n=1 Tax=Lactuca virosa TaxID=75947 RepID=A0AAU9LJX7_9ASTR|nr:unnamed protein product [Lactuca virosa]
MKVQSNSPMRQKFCTSSSRSVSFEELPPSSPNLQVHRTTTSRSVFRRSSSHDDEGGGDGDDGGVDLKKRSPSPARQSRESDGSKEGDAFVNSKALNGDGDED